MAKEKHRTDVPSSPSAKPAESADSKAADTPDGTPDRTPDRTEVEERAGGTSVGEIGGPKGPEPTRYGDWEVGGRCTDF